MECMWCFLTKQFVTLAAVMQGISTTMHAEGDTGAERASAVEESQAKTPLISAALVIEFSYLRLLAIGAINISRLTVFEQIFDIFVVLLRFLYFPLQIVDSWSSHDNILDNNRRILLLWLLEHNWLDLVVGNWVNLSYLLLAILVRVQIRLDNLSRHLWLAIRVWRNLVVLYTWLLILGLDRLLVLLHSRLGILRLVNWLANNWLLAVNLAHSRLHHWKSVRYGWIVHLVWFFLRLHL